MQRVQDIAYSNNVANSIHVLSQFGWVRHTRAANPICGGTCIPSRGVSNLMQCHKIFGALKLLCGVRYEDVGQIALALVLCDPAEAYYYVIRFNIRVCQL